jgi:hypothetical protein
LLSLEGIPNVIYLAEVINPFESVGRVPMHVSISLRYPSICVHDSEGMHRFRYLTEEIPLCVGIKAVLYRMLLESMEEIWCHHRISDEEHWEIDTHHIIVALFCIEL